MSIRLLRLAFILAFSLLSGPLLAQQTQENLWMTDGPVNTLLRASQTLYLGGSFGYVGPRTGSAAPFDAATGALPAAFPLVDGTVSCILPDGSGGWYIGGFFEQVGTVARRSLAHVLADYSVDPSWNPTGGFTGIGTNRVAVYALAQNGTTLYVGGSLSRIGPYDRSFLFSVTRATGTVTTWAPTLNNVVRTLAVSSTTVYAGGDFTTINNVARPTLAAFDAATGALLPWTSPVVSRSNGAQLLALALNGNTLFVGGQRLTGTFPSQELLALNASTGQLLPGWTYPPKDVMIRTLAIVGTTLYTGGDPVDSGKGGLQALNAASGAGLGPVPNLAGTVYSLATDGTTLYIGGNFLQAAAPRRRLAALTVSTGALLPWAPATNDQVNTLAVQNGTVYAGGEFASAGGLLRNNAAALNLTTGRATGWNPAPNGDVYRIFRAGSRLYLGGKFTALGTTARTAVAQVDSTVGIPTSWQPQLASGAEVRAFASYDSTLYFGGTFNQVNQQDVRSLAGVHLRTGQVAPYVPCSLSQVRDIAISGDTLFAVGNDSPTNYNLMAFENVTLHNRARISFLSTTPRIPGDFQTIKVIGSRIYAGIISGYIGPAAPTASPVLFCWDRKTGRTLSWNPLIRDWSPARYVAAQVAALLPIGNKLYVGGQFTAPQGGGASHGLIALDSVAAASSTTWQPLAEPYPVVLPYLSYNNIEQITNTLEASSNGSTIYVGGTFKQINRQLRTGLVGLSPAASTGQSISFTPPASLPTSTAYTLSATATSGLAVRFRIVGGTATATLSGPTLTPTRAGTLEVEAYQNGSLTYDGAVPVRRTITITTVTATLAGTAPLLQLSPNPARTSTELRLRNIPNGAVQVSLYNLQGQTLRQWPLHSTGSELRALLNTSTLAAGVYLVRVAGAGYHTTQRLMVQ